MPNFGRQLSWLAFTLFLFLGGGSFASAASICPSTSNTNSDCGYIITIGSGGMLTGAPVTGANPYDGSDDALVGVVNNSATAYNGSFMMSGSGNGGGIFAFDNDGICTYTGAAYCSTAAYGYEGPMNTFSNISASGSMGTVNIMGLAAGASTFFSLEGSPASIGGIVVGTPEPTTNFLLAGGLLLFGLFAWRKGLPGRQ